jgi:predicted transcriptional regulator
MIIICFLIEISKFIIMETKELVFKAVVNAGKAVKSGEIAETTGIDKKEIDKAIKKLVAEGRIISPTRCYYTSVK